MGIKCRLIETIGMKYEICFYLQGNPIAASLQITKEEFESSDEFLKAKFPEYASYEFFKRQDYLWNTEDGKNDHPGDMYWAPWMHDGFCPYWDDCKDPRGHLVVVMPDNDGYWDVDSRASNCTMPQDRNHKCWIKHGEAPIITVDKQGKTCQAGAGSIQMIHWHGYLRNGELVVA